MGNKGRIFEGSAPDSDEFSGALRTQGYSKAFEWRRVW
jgi:hypothetical protein